MRVKSKRTGNIFDAVHFSKSYQPPFVSRSPNGYCYVMESAVCAGGQYDTDLRVPMGDWILTGPDYRFSLDSSEFQEGYTKL